MSVTIADDSNFQFGEWLCTRVLKLVPHRQWVFSLPNTYTPTIEMELTYDYTYSQLPPIDYWNQ